MIGYTTLGTNNFDTTAAFYDALLAQLNATRLMDMGTFVLWGRSMDEACLALTLPFDQNPATVGNGVMIALRADSQEHVGEIHAKALALGGSDEGAPGPRGDGFYAGYFRDPDGNKLCAFFMG